MSEVDNQQWVVLDLETEGLVPSQCRVLECAAIHVGRKDLQTHSAVSWLVTHGSPGYMDAFVQEMHTRSGLLAALDADRSFLASTNQLLDDAHPWLDRALTAHFASVSPALRSIVLVGNSIHFDRAFLEQHCPVACKYLHHRMIDVSGLRMLYRAWVGEPQSAESKDAHRALSDCNMSLTDLRWFARNVFFNNSVPL
jgi:oligoribonuclease